MGRYRKLCKNCAFWKESTDYVGWGNCSNDIFEYTGASDASEKALFGYWDSESFAAGFRIKSNFCCIGFKNK